MRARKRHHEGWRARPGGPFRGAALALPLISAALCILPVHHATATEPLVERRTPGEHVGLIRPLKAELAKRPGNIVARVQLALALDATNQPRLACEHWSAPVLVSIRQRLQREHAAVVYFISGASTNEAYATQQFAMDLRKWTGDRRQLFLPVDDN